MKSQGNFKLMALCAILAMLLVVPALVQAKGEMGDSSRNLKGKSSNN